METRVLMDGVNFLAPPVNYSLPGQDAFPVVVADVKGDGVPDIITATQAHYLSVTAGSQFGRVFDLAGNGNGTFAPASVTYSALGTYSQPNSTPIVSCADALLSFAVGDISGDGSPDLVLAKSSYFQKPNYIDSPQLVILDGSAAGGGRGGFGLNLPGYTAPVFTLQNVLSLANNPTGITLGDATGDGNPDIVLTYSYSNDITIVPSSGAGTFQSTSVNILSPADNISVGNGPSSVALAVLRSPTLASNSAKDIVVANKLDNDVSVLLNIGSGTFFPAVNYPVGNAPDEVIVADVNNDGIPDIITSNGGGNSVSVLYGNGNGTFKPAQTFAVGTDPVSVISADINGDGIPDIITANAGSNSLSILLGNGDGTFQPQQVVDLGATPKSVAAADLTGLKDSSDPTAIDGRLDLVVSSVTTPPIGSSTASPAAVEVQVLLNTSTTRPRVIAANGTLNVYGTNLNDNIDLSVTGSVLTVHINTSTQTVPLSTVGIINVFGFAGNDSITIEAGVPPVFVGGGGGNDTIITLNATDTMRGGAGDDSIAAGSGNNFLSGGAGDDTLIAGTGNDILRGNSGDDSLVGGSGNDSLDGGLGNDTILANIGADTGSDTIVGGPGDDSIVAGPLDSVLPGTGGNDTVTGISS